MSELSEGQLGRYAFRSADSDDRVHPEPADPLRNPFELDRHRIIESSAFRRLEHKTQVFVASHHDHFRTRLTHTLEATQVARCLSLGLAANESLSEAITLAHDLGHPPFGHAGEATLDEAMSKSGGFNHNIHTLRVVEYLEHPFPPFRGLNLTAATRAGLAAHTTRYDRPVAGGENTERSVPGKSQDRSPGLLVEAQIASIADRIAYNCHDLEDAIGAEIVSLDGLAGLDLWAHAYDAVTRGCEATHLFAVRRAVLDKVLDELLTDVIATSLARLKRGHATGAVDTPVVTLSPDVESRLAAVESFLLENLYQHPEVVRMDARGRQMVFALFYAYRKKPDSLPPRFAERIEDQGIDRVACDYIAGMTDRFCEREYNRIAGG